jgi:dolichyl-phosphate-mannose-protein mannosyltransferase
VPVAALACLAALTRLLWYGYPKAAAIDEVYFAQYLSGYLTGRHTFDLHPPLGRLCVAAIAWLARVAPVPQSTPWNTDFAGTDYLFLRLGPLLAGCALPVFFYALAHRLFGDRKLAFVAGACLALDNALITQSRFLFFDEFLLGFGVLSLYAFARHRAEEKLGWLFAAGALAGCAGSVKWTGLTFVLLPALLSYVLLIAGQLRFRDVARVAVVMAGTALCVYVAIFAVHLALMPLSGPGDGFVSPAAQKALVGSVYANDPSVQPLGFVPRALELQRVMYEVNQRVGSHPFGSHWYEWPLDRKAMGYYLRDGHDIQLVGNDGLWWSGSAAMACLLGFILVRPRSLAQPTLALVVLGHLLNWLPFALIARVMFIHHYLAALLFSVLALVYVIARVPWLGARPLLFLIVPALGYLAHAEVTYGLGAPW